MDFYKFYVPRTFSHVEFYNNNNCSSKTIDGSINLHRAEFLKLLTDAIQPSLDSGLIRVHFNKRLKAYSYSQSTDESQIILNFSDSSTGEADILIGSDGVRSATRASMYTHFASQYPAKSKESEEMLKHVEPSWSGTFAYRALADPSKLTNSEHAVHQSASKGIVVRYFLIVLLMSLNGRLVSRKR